MATDIWHYPRTTLAKQVVHLFVMGLSSALVFFAPRRMGKTEFLLKDIQPMIRKKGWKCLYFSFLDTGKDPHKEFTTALIQFAEHSGLSLKSLKLFKYIKKVSGKFIGVEAGIEFDNSQQLHDSMKEVLVHLAKHKKLMLLVDEIQVLARQESNQLFIASLRTILDTNKDNIKVIFTGSSQAGLRDMFSRADAPFFHYGQNLPFPELDKAFTDHIANAFYTATKRKLDKKILWEMFVELDKVPQLIRALVERMVLNPNLSMPDAKEQTLQALINDREYTKAWDNCSALERLLLEKIMHAEHSLFSHSLRENLAQRLGVEELTVPSIQSAVRSLQRKSLISALGGRQGYAFDDLSFECWLKEH